MPVNQSEGWRASKFTVVEGAALCSKTIHSGKMTSKHRLTVNLSDDEATALARLAKRTKVSKAWLGRHAITTLLDHANNDGVQLPIPFAGKR